MRASVLVSKVAYMCPQKDALSVACGLLATVFAPVTVILHSMEAYEVGTVTELDLRYLKTGLYERLVPQLVVSGDKAQLIIMCV